MSSLPAFTPEEFSLNDGRGQRSATLSRSTFGTIERLQRRPERLPAIVPSPSLNATHGRNVGRTALACLNATIRPLARRQFRQPPRSRSASLASARFGNRRSRQAFSYRVACGLRPYAPVLPRRASPLAAWPCGRRCEAIKTESQTGAVRRSLRRSLARVRTRFAFASLSLRSTSLLARFARFLRSPANPQLFGSFAN